jgi:hypothetical protein
VCLQQRPMAEFRRHRRQVSAQREDPSCCAVAVPRLARSMPRDEWPVTNRESQHASLV